MACCGYLLDAINPDSRKRTIAKAIRTLVPVHARGEFDTIAFVGVSGALVAPAVADALDVPLVVVRKDEKSNRHSDYHVECAHPDGPRRGDTWSSTTACRPARPCGGCRRES